MQLSFNIRNLFFLSFLCVFFSNCSSQQQQTEQLESSDYEESEEESQYDNEAGEDGNEYDDEGGYGENGEGANEGGDGYNDQGSGENNLGDSYELGNQGGDDDFGDIESELGNNQDGGDLLNNQGNNGYNIGTSDSYSNSNSSGSGSGGSGERLVRYVLENDVSVYSEADLNSEVVATLMKGQPLVIVDMGEWSQISGDRYVKTSDLSEKIVPRHMEPADWSAP